MAPLFSWRVTREDHETAVQGSEGGEMQPRTVIAIVGAIVCFALLLLGFWLVARKPRSLPRPDGDRPNDPPQPRWKCCDFSRWFCLRRAGSPANSRDVAVQAPVTLHQTNPRLSHAAPSLAHTHKTEETLNNFHSGAFDLDEEIGEFMMQHAGRTGLVGVDGTVTDIEGGIMGKTKKSEVVDGVVTSTVRTSSDVYAHSGFTR